MNTRRPKGIPIRRPSKSLSEFVLAGILLLNEIVFPFYSTGFGFGLESGSGTGSIISLSVESVVFFIELS